jgi:hypothetical protein
VLAEGKMQPIRTEQVPLVTFLLRTGGLSNAVDSLQAQAMDDGGMGSMAFATCSTDRMMGSLVAECVFDDQDGTLVLASLILNKQGEPLEIDVFKTDFSALIRWPSVEHIREHS